MTNETQSETPISTQNAPSATLGKPIGKMMSSTDVKKTQEVVTRKRQVRFDFHAAKIDGEAVTDSDSNLKNLPYIIASATDKTKILTSNPKKKNPKSKISFVQLTGTKPLFNTETVNLPDDVEDVVIYMGNDAYETRRLHPLFKVTPNEQGVTIVTIYETYKSVLYNLQKPKNSEKTYPKADHNVLAKLSATQYVGYLTGDVWKELTYAFEAEDIARFCKANTLTRKFAEDRGRNIIKPQIIPTEATENTKLLSNGQAVAVSPATTISETSDPAKPLKKGEEESLEITDWEQVLQPIYSGEIQDLKGKDFKTYTCHIDLPVVNIRLIYAIGAFRNAIGSGEHVTIADVLKRTHPLAYKGVIEAAWKSGVDVLSLSSTWRPMLGSILHRMGVAIDVTSVDDLDDRDAKNQTISPFKVHLDSKNPTSLYSSFNTIVLADKENMGGFKADPWNRKSTDDLHKTHLHVSATDEDAV
jgi:hypothetical protein